MKFNKQLLLCVMLLVMVLLSGCISKNRVFSFDSEEIEKIVINNVEITDSELIEEISQMFARIDVDKVDGMADGSNYQYDLDFYDAEGHLVQYFLCDEYGLLFKAGNYNDPDIFGLNYYYSAYLDSDDLQRLLEIIG